MGRTVRATMIRCVGAALAALGLVVPVAAAAVPVRVPRGRAEYRVIRIEDAGTRDIGPLVRRGLDVERDAQGHLVAYVTARQMDELEHDGFTWTELPDPGLEALVREASPDAALAAAYHTYETLTAELQLLAAAHPDLARLSSAGTSVQGREMWWMKITSDPDHDGDKPAFKYLATMHGDEPVGMENCVRLIQLLLEQYATDARVRRLVDGVEIWIMPLVNPDGNALHQRYNAQGLDLNRSFPDLFDDPRNDAAGRPPEVANLMAWQSAHTTTLSANFHGGSLVVNYPYDNNPTFTATYSTAPDDDVLRDLALDYSEDNAPMHASQQFPGGVTNGAAWYPLSGGMQDWNYHWHGDMQMTIELDASKWPLPSRLDQLWLDNRESMLSFMERALAGVRGRVTDAGTGAPVAATLAVAGRTGATFRTDPAAGDYHRPLLPGAYTLGVTAPGYESTAAAVRVTSARSDATRVDIALQPLATRIDVASTRIVNDTNADGALDPGEGADLAVTLANGGATAHGLTATLRAEDPFLVAGSTASWPDVAPAARAESNPPHLAIAAAAGTPAGHRLAAVLDWQAANGVHGTTAPFFIPVGATSTRTAAAAGLPRSLPAGTVTVSTLTVPPDEEVDSVAVRVDVTHPSIGDLAVTLVAPDGTTRRLHDHSGGATADIHAWYGRDTRPIDDLAALAGHASGGTWTLRVAVDAGADPGTLTGWSLELHTRPWESPVAEVHGLTASRQGGTTRLSWWPCGSAQHYIVRRAPDPRSAASFANVTAADGDTTDTLFDDISTPAPGSCAYFLVTASGHAGEGTWGHFGR